MPRRPTGNPPPTFAGAFDTAVLAARRARSQPAARASETAWKLLLAVLSLGCLVTGTGPGAPHGVFAAVLALGASAALLSLIASVNSRWLTWCGMPASDPRLADEALDALGGVGGIPARILGEPGSSPLRQALTAWLGGQQLSASEQEVLDVLRSDGFPGSLDDLLSTARALG